MTLCFQQPLRSSKNAFIMSTVFVGRACRPLSFVPWCLSHSVIRWKMCQKTFVIVKTAVSRNVCFYRPVGSQRKDLILCTLFVKKPCGHLYIAPWHLSCSIMRGKIVQSLFITGKISSFQKIMFSKISKVLKKCPYRFQNNSQKSLWTLIKMFPDVYDSRLYEERRVNNFCHRGNSYFLKCLFLSTS